MKITKERITEVISHYGIGRGDVVALHSSLSSMGEVIGGAETVVDAFLETVGDRGTLLVPTFTFSLKMWADAFPAFNVTSTPSRCGKVLGSPSPASGSHPFQSPDSFRRIDWFLWQGKWSKTIINVLPWEKGPPIISYPKSADLSS